MNDIDTVRHIFPEYEIREELQKGRTGCIVMRINYHKNDAVLKIGFDEATKKDINENLKGYELMPFTIKPKIFENGKRENCNFVIMEYAGIPLPFISKKIPDKVEYATNLLIEKVGDCCTGSLLEKKEDAVLYLETIEDRFRRHLPFIKEKFSTNDDSFENIFKNIKKIIPKEVMYSSDDFSCRNILIDIEKERVCQIDPKKPRIDKNGKETAMGLIEVDLGFFSGTLESWKINEIKIIKQKLLDFSCNLRKKVSQNDIGELLFKLGEMEGYFMTARFFKDEIFFSKYEQHAKELSNEVDKCV